jgi:hypothetical protein
VGEYLPEEAGQDGGERLRQRLGPYHPLQVKIWRQMSGARRLDLVGQAYHLVLEAVRLTESRRHPDLPPDELMWRVIRRMHGDLSLGRKRELQAYERR